MKIRQRPRPGLLRGKQRLHRDALSMMTRSVAARLVEVLLAQNGDLQVKRRSQRLHRRGSELRIGGLSSDLLGQSQSLFERRQGGVGLAAPPFQLRQFDPPGELVRRRLVFLKRCDSGVQVGLRLIEHAFRSPQSASFKQSVRFLNLIAVSVS